MSIETAQSISRLTSRKPILKARIKNDISALAETSLNWEKDLVRTLSHIYTLVHEEFVLVKMRVKQLTPELSKAIEKKKKYVREEIDKAKVALDMITTKKNKLKALKRYFREFEQDWKLGKKKSVSRSTASRSSVKKLGNSIGVKLKARKRSKVQSLSKRVSGLAIKKRVLNKSGSARKANLRKRSAEK